jgi:glycine cleavage system regulatory protein
LGGLYVGSVLVELEPGAVDLLRSAVRAVDTQGLEVRIAPALEAAIDAGSAAPGAAGDAFQFSLVGQDRPGIVDQVTTVLSGLGANIETFRTWVVGEPQSGAPLFHMDARLRLAPEGQAAAVQAALEDISAEIMVDISLTPAR